MMRGSRDWCRDVAASGRWWEPAFWEASDYVCASPWNSDRLRLAFEVLRQLFRESEARTAFAWVDEQDERERLRLLGSPHWHLLSCVARPDLSALVRLGLDAVDAQVLQETDLVRRLRVNHVREFKGARFELRCLAAFRNAGIEAVFEPLAGGGKNPDFRLLLDGHAVYVDAKHADEGEWSKEELAWFFKLSMPDATSPPISARVRLTDAFQRLQDDEDGRRHIRANLDRLVSLISEMKLRLAASGEYPASDVIEGLIDVQVLGPPGTASGGSMTGVPTDTQREVARIVRNNLPRGAGQIPPNEVGVVLLNPGLHAPSGALVEEVQRWMNGVGEGDGYPNLKGVLVLEELLVEPVKGIMGTVDNLVPVWRDSAQEWLRAGPWDALSDAFADHDVAGLRHRCGSAGAPPAEEQG